MTDEQILQALKRLRVDTGSLACFGCGREHSCSVHGCQILREAAARLEHFIAENRALRSALASRPAKRAQKQARDASVTFLREMAKESNAQRAKAEAERDALREKWLWQPVSTGNPERKGCYLVTVHHWLDGAPVAREAFWNGVDWLSCERRHEITPRVTHWMPLPEAPEAPEAPEGGEKA